MAAWWAHHNSYSADIIDICEEPSVQCESYTLKGWPNNDNQIIFVDRSISIDNVDFCEKCSNCATMFCRMWSLASTAGCFTTAQQRLTWNTLQHWIQASWIRRWSIAINLVSIDFLKEANVISNSPVPFRWSAFLWPTPFLIRSLLTSSKINWEAWRIGELIYSFI